MATAAVCLLQDSKLVKSLINSKDECGQTLLIRTIYIEDSHVRRKTLEALLQVGVDAWVLDAYQRNALMWACLYKRDYEIAKLLRFVHPMELLQTDIYGNTALHLAVTSGSAAAVKLIKNCMIEHKLSLDIENSCGITPKMEALRLGHDVCYSLLTPTDVGVSDVLVYKHSRRLPHSSICGRVTSLPPILPPKLNKKMKLYDMRACYQLDDESPSNFLRKVCWKKAEFTEKFNKSDMRKLRLPKAVTRSEQYSTSTCGELVSPMDSRLPDINLSHIYPK